MVFGEITNGEIVIIPDQKIHPRKSSKLGEGCGKPQG
jgi:hypothetical protein